MRRFALILFLICTSPALAEDGWTRLIQAEIISALTGQTLVYENTAVQRFEASGRTLYKDRQNSWGLWEAREDQYCSQWPPAEAWTCYDLEAKGDMPRFVGPTGDIFVGQAK